MTRARVIIRSRIRRQQRRLYLMILMKKMILKTFFGRQKNPPAISNRRPKVSTCSE